MLKEQQFFKTKYTSEEIIDVDRGYEAEKGGFHFLFCLFVLRKKTILHKTSHRNCLLNILLNTTHKEKRAELIRRSIMNSLTMSITNIQTKKRTFTITAVHPFCTPQACFWF